MKSFKLAATLIVIASAFSNVVAEEKTPSNSNISTQEPAKTDLKPSDNSDKTFAKETTEKTEQKKFKTMMSLSAYKSLIATKIAARAKIKNSAGPGDVQATFRVNDEGRIDQISIKKSSSPALADHVRKILSGVVAPPPPEGAILLGQPFKFN